MTLFLLAAVVLANLPPLPFPLSPGFPSGPVTVQTEAHPADVEDGNDATEDGEDSLAWRIAARASGEADVVGAEGVYLVACTIVNRLRSPHYPETLDGVLRAYFAPDETPTAEYVSLAEKALSGGCPPVVYAFSVQDTAKLGFDRGSADFVVAHKSWALYFWADWPGRG